MPTGKKVSDEKLEVILKLKAQGLTYKQIASQVGLGLTAVVCAVRESRRKQSEQTRL